MKQITTRGDGLQVAIYCLPEEDWQAFAAWYSVRKFLPGAFVQICCVRNGSAPFQFFQWTKRLQVPIRYFTPFWGEMIIQNKQLLTQFLMSYLSFSPILLMPSYSMFLDNIPQDVVDKMNKSHYIYGFPCVFRGLGEERIEEREFCVEAREIQDGHFLASYQKGCGKWINTMEGCPFANTLRFYRFDMTVNEIRILKLWDRMSRLYHAVK